MYNIKYRSTFEDITALIVEFCQSHFMITTNSIYGTTNYNQARKPVILKSNKKDRLLKLNLIPVI
jgi:hypothetical protein|tara:strand:+ start:201 stop:395 length:195 start_codon:yes stop_codon:yes gene_type:complete